MGPPSTRAAERILMALALAVAGCSEGRGAAASDLPAILAEAAAEDAATNSAGSPARRAARESVRQVLEAEQRCAQRVGQQFWRPELNGYLFQDHAYVGGVFPERTAVLLREVDRYEADYLAEVRRFPELLRSQAATNGVPEASALEQELAPAFASELEPVVSAVEAHRAYVRAAAELYELMAARPDDFEAKREGLEFADPGLEGRFHELVREVDAAHDSVETALQAIDDDRRRGLHWLQLRRIEERSAEE